MKNIITFLLGIWLISSSLSAEPTQIECIIKPIERERIHPAWDSDPQTATDAAAYPPSAITPNWSGYVARGTNVTFVGGVWVVPTLSPTVDGTYSAIWVGIDGFRDGTVEQIGTSSNWVNGRQVNYAWFEMYPELPYYVENFLVRAGDLITAKVAYIGKNIFRMVIINHTLNIRATIPYSYTTSALPKRACAEWIVEAPGIPTLPLANFDTVTMKYCSATINGVKGPIDHPSWSTLPLMTMSSGGVIKSVVGNLTPQGTDFSSFKVYWAHQ